jgi:DNA-directed RNA polymerase subunit RPC12/RpoP
MSATYVCSICDAIFHNDDAFYRHMEAHRILGETDG